MSIPRGIRIGSLVCLLALSPSLALAQQPDKAGVVTTVKGDASVSRTTLARPAPLNLRDDVFFRDRVMTERDSIVRVLLGGKALLTIRELSDFTIQEEPNKATITLGLGRMALQVIKRLMRPGEEIEIRTPNAVAAIRGSFHFFDVTADQTIMFHSSPTTQTSAGTTYAGGADEMWTFRRGVPPLHRQLRPDEIRQYSQQFFAGIPKVGGDKPAGSLVNQITGNQTQQATALASTLVGQTGGQPFGTAGVAIVPTPPPPTNTNLCVNCQTTTTTATTITSTPPTPSALPPISKTGFSLESNLGPIITLPGRNTWCDDCTTNLSFGFSFPFLGHSYSGGELSSNGFISLGGSNGQGCCDPFLRGSSGFLDGAPRIALAWYDLFPIFTGPLGTVSYNTFPGRAVVTFNSVPEFPFSPPGNTMQMQLLSDGRIILLYPNVQPPRNHTSLIGVTQGGGVQDSNTVVVNDYSQILTPLNTGTVGTVYHLFRVGDFIQQGSIIILSPNGEGGWFVLDPPATDLAFFTLGSGNVATLQGSLLNNPSTPQTIIGDVAWIQGQLVVPGSKSPLVSLTGGPHSLAIVPGASIFDLAGSATAPEVVEGNLLTLGTDRPIRGDSGGAPAPLAVPLLQASGAGVGTEQVVRLDTALLEASAPLLNLLAGSTLVSNSDVLNLTRNARLTANLPSDALFNLNGSVLTIYNGSLANVAGGSALRVNGSLVSLTNGSTLNILNGWLANISGGSVFSLTGGSLATFGAGTNTLNLTNNTALCAGCSITTSIPNLGGIPVLLAGGATASNVAVSPGFVPFAGLNANNRVNVTGASGAVLGVSGATSRVVLRP